MIQIKILHLHCLLNDESDQDEVYLKHNGSRVWPIHGRYHKMNSGERVEINALITHDPTKDLEVELWDWDLLSSNDRMGTFQMHMRQGDFGKFTSSLRKAKPSSTANYMLEWQIQDT